MEFGRFLSLLFLVCLTTFLPATEGYRFYVGGRDGWVLKPSESYNHWAERNRFLVNDTLYFKYNKGSDSVLVVNKDSFFNCNTSNPIQKLEEGNSEFKFDSSGPFYFISGQPGNCANGQKLIIIVLAVRHRQTPPAQPSLAAPPQGSAPALAPSSSSTSSPSQAPSSNPTTSPVPAPAAATTPTLSPPSPMETTPTPSGDAPSGDASPPPPGSNQDSTAPSGAYGVTASSVLVSSVVVLVSLLL
ncbi:early nodulin-like protein 2 [Argentina anserina]|uniref:early nodulin-like protein 2 n=1 Tax=Argentina anserina TaxID=57926 RepID=UPI00217692CE|nr:early nodulin-like protein 2 [Potentilla anserina]